MQRKNPAEIIVPVVGGRGATGQSWSPIESTTYSFAPSLSFFLNDRNKATKSLGEEEHWTWTASEPFLPMCSASFLCSPHNPSETVMWDTHVPLSQCPCPPGQQGGWWKGRACKGSAAGTPGVAPSPAPLSVWSVLQAAPGSSPAHRRVCARIKHRMVFLWLSQPQLLAASLSLASCPSALASSPHTPAPAEAASGLPSVLCSVPPTARSHSAPGSFLCIRFVPGSPVLPEPRGL